MAFSPKCLAAAVALCAVGITTSAGAVSLQFQAFSPAAWQSQVIPNAAIEDFEQPGDTYAFEPGGLPKSLNGNQFGELDSNGYVSQQVGSFTSFGSNVPETFSGSTCQSNDIDGQGCDQIALQYDPAINGQGNLLPAAGFWSLNSNDTLGISWHADLGDGRMFDRVAFALKDAADTGDKRLDIFVDGVLRGTQTQLANANELLVTIDFGKAVSSAKIDIVTSTRDGVTIDGAVIAPVPLPATLLLLLGGLGALAMVRRRQTA